MADRPAGADESGPDPEHTADPDPGVADGPVVRVDVLGTLQVTRQPSAVGLPSGAPRMVLAVLASRAGSWVSGGELLDALVSLDPSRSWSRSTIHSAIWRLRRSLGDGVVGSDEAAGYRLEPGRCVVDAEVFGELARAGRDHLIAGESAHAADRLGEALALWRGSPFDDWSGTDWFSVTGQRLDEIRLGALEDLAAALLLSGHAPDAADALAGLVREAPLREHAWALLVRAHLEAGRAVAAQGTYDRARAVLAEVGLEPGVELGEAKAELEARLQAQREERSEVEADQPDRVDPADPADRSHHAAQSDQAGGPAASTSPVAPQPTRATPEQVPGGWPQALPGPVPLLASEPMVGRDAEVAWLLDRTLSTATTGMRVTVLEGEAGIGKSRVAAALVVECHDQHCPVWFELGEPQFPSPAGPLSNWVRRLSEAASVDAGARWWARGDDGVAPHFGPPGDSEYERWAFAEAVADVVAAAVTRASLLVIDDLHSAPPLALELLTHLLVSRPEVPLHVVATARPALAPSAAASPWSVLDPLPGATTLTLSRLDDADLATLIRGLADDGVGTDNADRSLELAAVSGGNPTIARAIARELASEGESDGDAVGVEGWDAAAPEGTTRRLIDAFGSGVRVSLELASVAAAVSPSAPTWLLASAAGGDAGGTRTGVVHGLDQAVELGLLRHPDGQTNTWAFAHDLVRSTIYRDLPSERREHLHAVFAESLIHRGTEAASSGVLADAAEHAWRAWPSRRVESAQQVLVDNAERLVDHGALAEAATWFQRAIELHEGAADSIVEERVELYLAVAEVRTENGELDAAGAAFDTAAALATDVQWRPGMAAAALGRAETRMRAARPDDPEVRLAARSLRDADDLDPSTLGELFGLLSIAAPAEADAIEDDLLAGVRVESGDRGVGAFLADWWRFAPLADRPQVVADITRIAVEGDLPALADVAALVGWITDVQEGRGVLLDDSQPIRSGPGPDALPRVRWAWSTWLTAVSTAAGQLDDARAHHAAARSVRFPRSRARAFGVVPAARRRAIDATLGGFITRIAEPSARLRVPAAHPCLVGVDLRALAAYRRLQGGEPVDPAVLRALGVESSAPIRTPVDLLNAVVVARLAAACEQIELVDASLVRLLPHAHRHVVLDACHYHGSVHHTLGVLHEERGAVADAGESFKAAVAEHRRVGVVVAAAGSLARLRALGLDEPSPGSGPSAAGADADPVDRLAALRGRINVFRVPVGREA